MACESTISCCKDCNDRHLGCHSNCVTYNKQLEEWKLIKERADNSPPPVYQYDFNNYVGKRIKRLRQY